MQETLLERLPFELLLIITDYSDDITVATLQKASSIYFGDGYWRSRIDRELFHEAKAVGGETLNWQYMCLELGRLVADDDRELEGRRWVLRQLDEFAALL